MPKMYSCFNFQTYSGVKRFLPIAWDGEKAECANIKPFVITQKDERIRVFSHMKDPSRKLMVFLTDLLTLEGL